MSDHDLNRRLTAFAADVESGTTLVAASAVRRRGDRRRASTRVATVGLGTVVAAAVVATAASGPVPGGSVAGSGGPSGSARPWPTGPGATASATPTRPAPHWPPADLPARPGCVPSTVAGGPATGPDLPAGLTMLHEGEPSWTVDRSRTTPSRFNPTGGADVTLAGRTAARTLTGPGRPIEEAHSPTVYSHQVFLFTDQVAARAAFTALVSGGEACGWINAHMNPGEEGRRVSMRWPGEYTPDLFWLRDVVLVLDGNALLVAESYTSGGGMSSGLSGDELRLILSPLCAASVVCA
ncbi:hypothetical protein AB0M43_01195 [Longispora sp. NPDC051575]|uniref:hypothetical protein n=1 Tax=Longispora sp. NPDC051575 TaxID=3154943 RepID=UPI00342D923F